MENCAESGGGWQYRQETQQWRLRDTLAAAILFLGTAAFVGWQNTRVAVLWDLGYLLDTSWRIALRQMPYRDFPLVHAPITFLIQAALIKLFARHFLVPVIYAAAAGGLGSVMAWRTMLRTLCSGWWMSLLLSAPLVVVGVYAIYPHPIYDCDCALAILLAMLLLMRVDESRGWVTPFCGGAACVVPLFVKQNMGLPFLAAVIAVLIVVLVIDGIRSGSARAALRSNCAVVLIGTIAAILLSIGLLGITAGLHSYIHWTVEFAAQRRLPGLSAMLSVYAQPSLLWMAPVLGAGLALCLSRFADAAWARTLACALMAAPFVYTLIFLMLDEDADDRADNLLALWPLWMLAAGAVALWSLRRGLTVRTAMPFIVLAAIHGTFLSQQLWGSTYALWPLLMVLIAVVLAEITPPATPVAIGVAAVACITFATCGGLYAGSLERLNYIDIPEDAPVELAQTPALRGAAARGPYLTNLDELVRFSDSEIPREDALLLLPGEDPFYFATARAPQFPVTLFDPATDPYSPAQLIDEARKRNVRWVIVKRVLQSKANVMPGFDETLQLLDRDYAPYRTLAGYEVYHCK